MKNILKKGRGRGGGRGKEGEKRKEKKKKKTFSFFSFFFFLEHSLSFCGACIISVVDIQYTVDTLNKHNIWYARRWQELCQKKFMARLGYT